jgi:exosortase
VTRRFDRAFSFSARLVFLGADLSGAQRENHLLGRQFGLESFLLRFIATRLIDVQPPLVYGVRADRFTIAAALAASGAFFLLYGSVFARLVDDWAHDDNYSHGFVIVPLALWFAWTERDRVLAQPIRPSAVGLAGLAGCVALLLAGVVGAELFVMRFAMVASIAAIVLFLFGIHWLRALAFPIALLLLMIPLPAIVFNRITLPLQMLGSVFGVFVLSALNVPVLREGNVINLSNTSLEVAAACSGIRSLVTLLTLAIVYGRLAEPSGRQRLLLAVASVPIAVVSNGLRIAGTGFAAQRFGPAAAEGFFHEFSGWVVFVVAFLLLLAFHRTARLAAAIGGGAARAAGRRFESVSL